MNNRIEKLADGIIAHESDRLQRNEKEWAKLLRQISEPEQPYDYICPRCEIPIEGDDCPHCHKKPNIFLIHFFLDYGAWS